MTTTESETQADFGVPSKEESESFGTWLRRQRELREITLREIADTSKISLRYLQALEDDRFELLPAPVFAKGFLRQYARYVGLDPEETVNFYLSVDRESEEDSDEEVVSQRRPRAVGTWPYAVAVVIVAVVLMAIVWILLQLNQSSEAAVTEAGESAAIETGAGAGEGADVPSAAAPEDGEGPAAETAQVSSVPPEGAAEVPPVPPESAAESGGSRVAATDPRGADPRGAAGAETGGEASRPSPESLYVTLDFRDDCWVRATVDGETREDRVYTQGESLQLFADELVELELGNAFAVEVEVEGHRMDLGGSSRSAVRRFSIDRETARALKRGDAG